MRIPGLACVGTVFLAAVVCEGAIAPVEDPDACLSTEQRAELAQRSKEIFFRGRGTEPLALAQAKVREASDAHERATADLRRCEESVVAREPGAERRCSAQRAMAADLEQRVAIAKAEHAKRSVELADELTARARTIRAEFPSCAAAR